MFGFGEVSTMAAKENCGKSIALAYRFTKSAATELVNCLNSDSDDDWTYKVDDIENPVTGETNYLVAVYDEDGLFLDYMR